MIGSSLIQYRITAKLGEGGMGEVYRATDTRLGREVAIKVLPASLSGDPQSLARFEREAKALAALNHPHIAAIHGFEADQGTHFLVLELVEGETLSERLRSGALSLKEALIISRQIAEAIQEAHEKGIVHRDLKPGNVKITPNGRVKVLDFGLAKLSPGSAEVMPGQCPSSTVRNDAANSETEASTVFADATTPGAIMGTAAYMSPEQARGQEVDKRTDIWAFGCCLYECLCGQKPFRGATGTDLIAEVLKSEPDWSQLPAEAPHEISTLLKRCLEKEPSRRLSSLGDIAILLEESIRLLAPPPSSQNSASSSPHRAPPPIKKQYSIAVMPFVNMSSDKENEYFSDGITEDLISALSQIEDLRVPARTSAFAFKGRQDDIRSIGQRLRVSLVLEGTVRRAGNKLRITAQLIDVADGFQIWCERYDRELKDIFEIQDEIAGRVVSALKMKLGVTEKQRMEKKATSNLEAYDLYLLGRYLWTRRQSQDLPKVFELFQQALEKDPNYALAYSGMADYYLYQGYFFGSIPSAEAISKARVFAEKAITLDPKLGEAHVSLGLVKLWLNWDFLGAGAELDRAMQLNPHYASAYHFRGMQFWGTHRRVDDALAILQRGLDIDPLSVPLHNMRAIILSQAGRHEQVIEETKKILELDPHHVWEYFGRAYEKTGQPEHAMHWYLRWLEEDGVKPETVAQLRKAGEAEGLAGFHRLNAQLLIESDELLPLARHWQRAYRVQACARLGRLDDAFRILEQSFADKEPVLVWLKVDLRFELLRDDPRFIALARKIGFPE
jgi:serine/threonine protein kinase/tetratricopeptide (TPR) repeat protein